MHGFEELAPTGAPTPDDGRPWYTLLTRYHWFVLIVAALGWLFDTMDQQLFVLAKDPAMAELLSTPQLDESGKPVLNDKGQPVRVKPVYEIIKTHSGYATTIFMLGWASGGLFFGVLGDRIGRAKTMLITILIYSLCTGLSAFSIGFYDFSLYRFLTGLGVGGEFAVGVSLVAEVMPDRARPFALGLLQALSAVGNITAALIQTEIGILQSKNVFTNWTIAGFPVTGWRVMFVIGILPALLAIVIRRGLKEPERWQAAAHVGTERKLGSYSELFADPRWRHNALVGLALAFSGVVGLWGIGFFTFDLIGDVLTKRFKEQGMAEDAIAGTVGYWKGIASIMFNLGAFFGIYGFSYVTHLVGRKATFAVCFLLALGSTALVFSQLDTFAEVFWMVPLAGFCQLSLFGGFAIYFPELFPTRLRSTGTSFCYNVGRFVASPGPSLLGLLTAYFSGLHFEQPMRPAGLAMCSIYLLGLFVLPFAPETKDRPLPE